MDASVVVQASSLLTGETVERVIYGGSEVDGWSDLLLEPPGVNEVQAGRTVPIDFHAVDAHGEPITDASRITVRSIAQSCPDAADTSAPEATDDAGNSGLRHMGDGWWRYNWQTDRAWSETCRTFSVFLEGGGRHGLWFAFR